jgi:hypothetical protein
MGSIPSAIGLLTQLSEYCRDWCKDVHTLILIILFHWWRRSSFFFQQCIDGKYPFCHWKLDKIEWVLSWLVQWRPYVDSNYSVPLVAQLIYLFSKINWREVSLQPSGSWHNWVSTIVMVAITSIFWFNYFVPLVVQLILFFPAMHWGEVSLPSLEVWQNWVSTIVIGAMMSIFWF